MSLPRRLPLAAALVVCLSCLASADDSERSVTARVDAQIQKGWENAGIKPAPAASDAAFIRRAYLDLTGVIPTVGQVREFLRDTRPDKRERLIDSLLGQPGKPRDGNSRHATHLANIWQEVMLPQISSNIRFRFQAGTFNLWLRNHFAENTPYDKMVRELLTYSGQVSRSGPALYYQVLELKPEELAASTSRIFLGVQIQCAQCHNHPFDHWTQQDFWSYAAFFAQLKEPVGRTRFVREVTDTNSGEVKLPNTETVVKPQFLGDKATEVTSASTRRQQLARWLTSQQNPYFARATVNRVWAVLFGYGLVNPVDDFGKHNPASHPVLLNLLADDFAKHGYDLRRLFRILAKSQAYQLSSEVRRGEAEYPHLFNRMAVKSLTPEQIYDCLEIATAKRETVTTTQTQYRNGYNSQKQAFIAKFEAPTQAATEFQGGIPQALTMMNGQFIDAATNVSQSDILQAIAEAPFMTDEQRIEALFLATLCRKPTAKEQAKFVPYVKSGGPAKDTQKALSDVMWALLNSTEFLLNH